MADLRIAEKRLAGYGAVRKLYGYMRFGGYGKPASLRRREYIRMNMNKKHLLIMLSYCFVPLAAFWAVFVFKIPATGVVYADLALLCVAMQLPMMRNMTGHDHNGLGHDHLNSPATRPQLHNRAPVEELKG